MVDGWLGGFWWWADQMDGWMSAGGLVGWREKEATERQVLKIGQARGSAILRMIIYGNAIRKLSSLV